MNYYAQGGQAHGLKALAQELPKYGRYGDSIVAHINPEEAGILKALGGSGTINPTTGLPEFFKIGNIFRPVQQAAAFVNPFNPGSGVNKIVNDIPIVGDVNKAVNNLGTQVFQPLEKAFVQPASRGLAEFDKQVAKTIPGGWGTVGAVALSAMGAPVPLQVAYGAARGSGVMRKGGSFNLQGAMIGGATAYATAELGEYMRGAAPGSEVTPTVDSYGNLINPAPNVVPPTDGISSLYNSTGGFAEPVTSSIPQSAINSANAATAAAQNVNPATGLQYGSVLGDTLAGNAPVQPSIMSNIMGGNFSDAASQIGTNISEGASSVVNAPGRAIDSIANYDYSSALDKGLSNANQTGQGALNLLGVGEGTAKAAAANAATTGIKALPMAAMALYGETSLSALDDQRKYLEEAKRANAISQAEYDAAMAEINRSTEDASRAVRENPFNTNPDRSYTPTENTYDKYDADENLYARLTGQDRLYKEGGQVKHYLAGSLVSADGTSTPTMDFMALQQYMQNAPVRANQTIYEQPVNKMTYDQSSAPMVTKTLPPGIIAPPPNSANLAALGSFYNPVTGEEVTVPSGGYTATPESGFFAGSNPRLGQTLYRKNKRDERLYAMGGSVDDEYGIDESRGLGLGNLSNGFMNMGSTPAYASGGMPRFLSGGGDGMSDSIKASINGDQEARLADGEFVVPADVVSHLGNGSSKAGAKQLYSMMDKVRQARVGTKKQGKQINPRKYLPA
jgi:hypothetical protein